MHLDLQVEGALSGADSDRAAIGIVGRFPQPLSAQDLCSLIETRLQRVPLHVGEGPARIETLGLCTGAAQDFISYALHK